MIFFYGRFISAENNDLTTDSLAHHKSESKTERGNWVGEVGGQVCNH